MGSRMIIRLGPIGLLALLVFFAVPVQAQSDLDKSDEIVYIDSNGYIRVLDPDQTGSNPAVKWRSPDAGWHDVALGDFNADGDDEIAAIGAWTDDDDVERTRLFVYDPVVASGYVDPEKRINGIGWTTLYTQTVPALIGDPVDVAVGKFSSSGVADGIVVSTVLPDVSDNGLTPSRITLLSATSGDGRNWETRFYRDFRHEWDLVRAGNVNNTGLDEVVLVDEGMSVLSVYRIDNGMTDEEDRFYNNGSESKKWNDAIVTASWENMNQLVTAREAPIPLSSFIVFQYQNADDEWIDLYDESFVPPPLRLFSADINASGDEEVFLLRDVPPDNAVQPRLFMRHLGFDTVNPFEATLDSDNGYREGAGGDFYGEDGGKDEIVIIRDNFIRIFTEPEFGQNYLDFGRTTNVRTVLSGDLDAIGFVRRPNLTASPDELIETIDQGMVSGPYFIEVTNTASATAIPFTYTVRGTPAWITVEASADHTPATFQVYLDATKLLVGDYSTAIKIETSELDVEESQLLIPINVTVDEAIVASPDSLQFIYESCDADAAPQSRNIRVSGLDGQAVTANIVPPVSWATAEPSSINLPSTVTVTVDPGERNTIIGEAVLLLAESPSGGLERSVPIYLICANQRIYLPSVAN